MFKIVSGLSAIGILGATLALGACSGSPYQLTGDERQTAELGARDQADRTQSDFVGCSGQDSDRDGYVACSTRTRAAPVTEREILCSYAGGSRGCKRKG